MGLLDKPPRDSFSVFIMKLKEKQQNNRYAWKYENKAERKKVSERKHPKKGPAMSQRRLDEPELII